jgi:hypothetical protein
MTSNSSRLDLAHFQRNRSRAVFRHERYLMSCSAWLAHKTETLLALAEGDSVALSGELPDARESQVGGAGVGVNSCIS